MTLNYFRSKHLYKRLFNKCEKRGIFFYSAFWFAGQWANEGVICYKYFDPKFIYQEKTIYIGN